MNCLKAKNFSVEYNTKLSGFVDGERKYFVSIDGKIKSKNQSCPHCGCVFYVDNGYHLVEDEVIVSLGLKVRVAQFKCKLCFNVWSSERELIDEIINQQNDLIKSLLLGCVRRGLSFENSCKVVEDYVGFSYSPQYLYEIYVNFLDEVKKEKVFEASGIYNYDEQFLIENGEKVCRLTIKDAVTNKIICDERTTDKQKNTIIKLLKSSLKNLPVLAFIFDMDQKYPEIIKEIFPKAKIQWCIFHLYKIIWKEFHDELGKNIPLNQLYNAYLLFDIFFDHEKELKKLEEFLKKFEKFKSGDFKSDKEIQKGLIQEFYTFVKRLKKERRREKNKISRRTLKQSQNRFNKIKKQILLYPKKIQKRIKFIDENFEKFTLFQRDSRIQPTNNGLEQYFSATLSKTAKKDFRSKNAIIRELNASKNEWNGRNIFQKTKISQLLINVGRLFILFPP